jgi:diguanylate cyclase (GGDEF)-like protein
MQKSELSNLSETLLMDDDEDIKASSRDPYLIIFIGKDSGKRHKLKAGIITIGRSPQADITIDDDRISRVHCALKWSDGTLTVEDKGSRNGTYVDSHKISHADLPPGVFIQLGHSVMKIEYKDKAEVEYEQSLTHQVSTDSLTGIYNRQHFTNLALKEIAYARRYQQTVGIIIIDIDNFKRVNETYGRAIGDLVLVQLADIICEKKRDENLLGRYGGKKFIILQRGEVDKKSIHRQCERIRRAVESFKFCHADACVQITVSIGFYLDRPDNRGVGVQIDDLIDKAEQTLYRAKEEGRNQTFAVKSKKIPDIHNILQN